MKKTLSLVLTVLMVAMLFCFGTSAAEGTAITDAAGFAAMAADGTYYLDADITISETYATLFTGTLDGNGHTITTSVPLFKQFGGTIKNLTVAGEVIVTGGSTKGAVIAQEVPKNAVAVFEKVTNNANLTGEYRSGAFVGVASAGASDTTSVTMIDCVNNGNVIGKDMIGGLIGYQQRTALVMTNCKNTGSVTVLAEKTACAGGLVGRFGGDNAFAETSFATLTSCVNEGEIIGTSYVGGIMGNARGALVTFDRCSNSGAITTDKDTAAGILGTGGASGYLARCYFTRCTNTGACLNKGLSASGTAAAAGMCGYIYGSGADGVGHFRYCINKGDMTGQLNDAATDPQHMFVSQMMGYTNNVQTSIESCCGVGKLDGKYKVICGLSSADPQNYVISDLTVAEGAEYFSYATADTNAAHIVTLADYMAAHAGAITISDVIPEYPAEDPTEAPTEEPTEKPTEAPTQAKDEPTEAPTQAEEEPTKAPEQPTEAPKKDKGCSSVIACGVAFVAILGTAYVAKKKF